MLSRLVNLLPSSLRGWLKDEPPRWDEATARADLLKAERERDEARSEAAKLRTVAANLETKLDAANRMLETIRAEANVVIEENLELKAQLANARTTSIRSSDAMSTRLLEATAAINEVERRLAVAEENEKHATAALAAVRQVVGESFDLIKKVDHV